MRAKWRSLNDCVKNKGSPLREQVRARAKLKAGFPVVYPAHGALIMSLFSRIDRLRTGGPTHGDERDDEGVFAIPDLGTPKNSGAQTPDAPIADAAPVAKAETPRMAEPAPRVETPRDFGARDASPKAPGKRLSPLERLARRAADMEAEAQAQNARSEPPAFKEAPLDAPLSDLVSDDGARKRPVFEPITSTAFVANGEASNGRTLHDSDSETGSVASLPDAVTPFDEHLGRGAPTSHDESEDDPYQAGSSAPLPDVAAPVTMESAPIAREAEAPMQEAPSPTPPVASNPAPTPVANGATAFDRLMAARATTAGPDTPRASVSSLAERLATMRAHAEAQSLSTPDAAPVEPVAEARALSAGALASENLSLDDEIPDSPSEELIEAETPPVEFHLAEEPASLNDHAPDALPETGAIAASSVEALAVPVEEAPPLPWNAPAPEIVATPRASIAPQPASPTPSPSVPMGSSAWAQRLAGRDALRDAPVAASETLVPVGSAPVNEPTQALDIAAGQLARTGGEGEASESEGRNRSLYRQKHFIFDAVLGALDAKTLQNATRESVKAPIERAVDMAVREFNLSFDGPDRSWMIEEFIREVTDLGPLVGLLEDVSVNKVLVVGSTDVAVERLGRIERTGVSFRDDDHLLSVVRRIAELTGGRIDAKVPLLDRPLPDGARIRAKIPPLAPQPTLTVEKSTGNPFVALKRQQVERGRENALPYALLRERIQQRLLREFEGNAAALGNPERLRTQVEEMIGLVIAEEKVAVTRAERAALVMDLLNEIVGLGPIEPLLNDPDVDEIMVNGPFQIYVERKGKLEIAPQRFRDNNHVMQVIERIVAPLGRRVDEKSPMVDGRLRDGSRFNAIIPPLALSGPTMTIRKFARDPLTMTDLINFGSLTRESAQFLQAAVEGRLNIVVSGGTGSGKTTTLNVLSSFIPSTERIVTIEDAAELQLRQEHIVRLETRPANIEGSGEIAIRDLVRNSLRMRPDRIVVGECRGGEALDMLQAMNTGHDGSLTTAHSNGPRDTVKRLETMVMMSGFDLPVRAIREQISMAVQLIVHQERMRDGKRRITAITELVGMEGEVVTMQDIFRFEQERVDEEGRIIGSLVATGLRPHNFDKIVDNGGHISMDMFSPRTMGGRDGDLRSRLSERR